MYVHNVFSSRLGLNSGQKPSRNASWQVDLGRERAQTRAGWNHMLTTLRVENVIISWAEVRAAVLWAVLGRSLGRMLAILVRSWS